mgnify:CR=1 FL=1
MKKLTEHERMMKQCELRGVDYYDYHIVFATYKDFAPDYDGPHQSRYIRTCGERFGLTPDEAMMMADAILSE